MIINRLYINGAPGEIQWLFVMKTYKSITLPHKTLSIAVYVYHQCGGELFYPLLARPEPN